MKNYFLSLAINEALEHGIDVQRNHNSIGHTEVVVSWNWELVRRKVYTTGNAIGQAAFISRTVDMIMQVVNAKFHGVLYQSASGLDFAVIAGNSFVWDRSLKLWQLAISSVHHIESTMKRIGDIKVRRTKMYWPEEI
ncbi:hypothetical protein FDJ47_gp29 [Enterobacter phage Ec_L1]|uniref:Uncharacterized protein n=1 Tax=Enterobacter phage Ec_L1 TaxID=2070180 RepID=A0A2P0W9Y1_9CAUD|nr:hypothetical protein FDJ47_gp29 [Enterobacter phage Ec_L1]AUV57143.1 hypothetical protein Ec29 [Enterobacter phage Ec_L1]